MKKLFLLLALALTSGLATAQVQKSLIKSFNLSGTKVVVLDLKGQVELKTSDNAALRLQTDIDLKNGNINLFQVFLTKKRYDVQVNNGGNNFVMTAPDRDIVRFGGADLQETVSYIVYLPEGVTAKMQKTDGLQTHIVIQATPSVAVR